MDSLHHLKIIKIKYVYIHIYKYNKLKTVKCTVNAFADCKIMLNGPASNICFILHDNQKSRKMTFWYSPLHNFHYVILYPNLMTVQRKGVPLKELIQVKDSSAKSMAGREGTAPTKNGPNTPCPLPAKHRKTPQLLPYQSKMFCPPPPPPPPPVAIFCSFSGSPMLEGVGYLQWKGLLSIKLIT